MEDGRKKDNYPSATLPRSWGLKESSISSNAFAFAFVFAFAFAFDVAFALLMCLCLLGFAFALPSHTHTRMYACCCIRSPSVLENAPDPAYISRIGIEQGCATLATPNVPTKLYSSSNSQIGATSCSALFRCAPSALEYAGLPEWCDDNLSVVVASLEPLSARKECVE